MRLFRQVLEDHVNYFRYFPRYFLKCSFSFAIYSIINLQCEIAVRQFALKLFCCFVYFFRYNVRANDGTNVSGHFHKTFQNRQFHMHSSLPRMFQTNPIQPYNKAALDFELQMNLVIILWDKRMKNISRTILCMESIQIYLHSHQVHSKLKWQKLNYNKTGYKRNSVLFSTKQWISGYLFRFDIFLTINKILLSCNECCLL